MEVGRRRAKPRLTNNSPVRMRRHPALKPPQALVNGGEGITSASVALSRGPPVTNPRDEHSDGDGE